MATEPAHARDRRSTAILRGVTIVVICGGILVTGWWAGGMVNEMIGSDRARPMGAKPAGFAAAGNDSSAASTVPAPPDSKLFGLAGQTVRYSSGLEIPAVVAYYRTEMTRLSWKETKGLPQDYARSYPGELLFFEKGSNHRCIISVSRSEVEHGTAVTVIAN